MEETHVVTCFLRNRGRVLLFRRSGEVGSYTGQWGAVAGHAAEPGSDEPDPDWAARQEIDEEADLADAVTLVRRGDPFTVEDADLGTRWVVHPYLFDCATRDVTPNEETTEYEWVPPTEMLRRETVPDLWTSYDRVRPSVETVADDREHGAAYISVRALEVLRDAAALAADRDAGDWDSLASLAGELLAARPTMTVVANRVNRVMAAAVADRTARAVEDAAHEAIDAALEADDAAAEAAGETLAGQRIATLSRSGTVSTALARADPEAVLVAESRPGREGVGVAEALAADGADVTLVSDAGLAWELANGEYDAVLVGADTVLPDGRVVNKVGTRAAALAGAHEDVPIYAVAASDKISPDSAVDVETADPTDVYDGDADLDVSVPLFDVTPPDLLAGVVTEDGLLDGDAVRAVADEHSARAAWQD
ncbi:NUDIX domain-containing protein [Halorientalis brevis]|uniref:NUDIX domain-containing protein n=1 Tax=Halorientalis brevis TaxID=1126241 RepID=A0ABD6CC29_9EURY|nr:NUDIX domain-containing protein [Halorientalis brevis]